MSAIGRRGSSSLNTTSTERRNPQAVRLRHKDNSGYDYRAWGRGRSSASQEGRPPPQPFCHFSEVGPQPTALFSLASLVIQAFNHLVDTPARTTAAAFPRYSSGEVLADSASLQWPGLFVRRSRFPRAVDRFLVPAIPEPLMSCVLAGSAEFRERDVGQAWVRRQLKRGDIFVTRSKTPYELAWRSPVGVELDGIIIDLAGGQFLAALEADDPAKAYHGQVRD